MRETSLAQQIAERIATSGPMPFAAFMSLALYHPRSGYYARSPTRSGPHGHFVTSPELDPAYGALWARAVSAFWDEAGRPESFDVFEIGPGEGGLAASLIGSLAPDVADALTYRMIERIPALRERQHERLGSVAERVAWHGSLQEAPRAITGIVIANEVLDNLPVHVVEKKDGEIHEVCVVLDGDEGFSVRLLPPSNPELEAFFDRLGVEVPEGHRAEVCLAAESLVEHAASRIDRGILILIDYGLDASSLVQRPGGTLVAYSEEGADERVLDRPGERDITAHVNWTAVDGACKRAGFLTQGPFEQRAVLRALGSQEIDAELRAAHTSAAEAGHGADAVAALSRRQALGALTDPAGLGGLGVLFALRELPAPAFLDALARAPSTES